MPQCAGTTSSPTLIVVSGPPGSGKTTLARKIAAQIGCPLIIRDEIKQGLVMARPGYKPGGDDPLNLTALSTFTDVLTTLLKSGTTTVAEAAFQDRLWRPLLEGLAPMADIRIIRCELSTDTAHARVAERAATDVHRAAHGDAGLLEAIASGNSPIASFVPIAMDLPTLIVDTSDDYRPGLSDIIAFATRSTR
ncbi:AAA family ATPase [Actinocorallia populi]|uniref:AAA family ATPase n=1 Tax=Actinocorallia populi TaxID=2079200 RepID=UPI0018E59292|nr:ATP-binding protein [Actinocorallia populi]